MSEPQWKRNEREIAAKLGGRRIPASGRAGMPDVAHDWLAVECKTRKKLPVWLQAALSQAEEAAGLGQLPIAVLHESGTYHDEDIVMMRLRDFREWFGF